MEDICVHLWVGFSHPTFGVLRRCDRATRRIWSSVSLWMRLDPSEAAASLGNCLRQHQPWVSYCCRALCPLYVLLTVNCGWFWLGNKCQVSPRNALCKDKRSPSRIEKQLLPYSTWPCSQRVHHHVVETLTLHVAQKSCWGLSVLDKPRGCCPALPTRWYQRSYRQVPVSSC